jgi:hypothetical protein
VVPFLAWRDTLVTESGMVPLLAPDRALTFPSSSEPPDWFILV